MGMNISGEQRILRAATVVAQERLSGKTAEGWLSRAFGEVDEFFMRRCFALQGARRRDRREARLELDRLWAEVKHGV